MLVVPISASGDGKLSLVPEGRALGPDSPLGESWDLWDVRDLRESSSHRRPLGDGDRDRGRRLPESSDLLIVTESLTIGA